MNNPEEGSVFARIAKIKKKKEKKKENKWPRDPVAVNLPGNSLVQTTTSDSLSLLPSDWSWLVFDDPRRSIVYNLYSSRRFLWFAIAPSNARLAAKSHRVLWLIKRFFSPPPWSKSTQKPIIPGDTCAIEIDTRLPRGERVRTFFSQQLVESTEREKPIVFPKLPSLHVGQNNCELSSSFYRWFSRQSASNENETLFIV